MPPLQLLIIKVRETFEKDKCRCDRWNGHWKINYLILAKTLNEKEKRLMFNDSAQEMTKCLSYYFTLKFTMRNFM